MKTLTLWRIWDDHDMALSDSYFPTKREALAMALDSYDAPASLFQPDPGSTDTWLARLPDDAPVSYVYLERIRVQPTRAGIAHALQHIPHR